ncbi:MAG: twin-arginine translocation signal domain-containing protein [Verrucomicrobia bacterium]|nr:twin-arginine translocation signal domain-containing protein [Verrucomicrobiota bacterium]
MKSNLSLSRRQFLQRTVAAGAGVAAAATWPAVAATPPALPEPSPQRLPRWRGFNLLEKFSRRQGGNPPFVERDFEWMAEWGFNFARLPMSYLCWTDAADWLKLREPELEHIDQAVALGQRHGVHVNLNFHRAPGYCVNPPPEPLDLWTDDKALEACAFHWAAFAKRYRGIPNARLSFDLLNEPKDLPTDAYVRVVTRLVAAIRAEDPQRLIVADGLRWGNKPVPQLIPLKLAQSTRGYQPMRVSHHGASWVRGENWPVPTWPLKLGENDVWDKERLRREQIEPWQALERQGVGVHVGEWGAYSKTPHAVALAWMRDCLDLWKEAGWGWALWNFRGSFGVLDSGRAEVTYEDWRGHKLDRAMLDLLQSG